MLVLDLEVSELLQQLLQQVGGLVLQLDPNLRLLLKNNIVLQWGDALFWEKMRYSLPDLQQAQPQTPVSSFPSYRPHSQQPKQLQGSVNHALHM